jgi:hypothetical protein
MPRPLIDMTGQKYGDLTVLSISHIENREGGGTIVHWKCKCECGKITHATRGNLRRPQTKSCGCQTAKFRKSVKWQKFSERARHATQR